MTTVLLCTVVLFACFCKKEKCPGIADKEKNPLGYWDSERLVFVNYYPLNNKTDSSIIRVNYDYNEGNKSSSLPPDKNPCACFKEIKVNFKIEKLGDLENSHNYYILSYFKYSETKEEVTSTNYQFKKKLDSISFENVIYKNVFYDSTLYAGEPVVKIYNEKEGLIAYKFYKSSDNKAFITGVVKKKI